MRVEPSPATKDAREWFDEFDTDRSGELDGGEVAALYRQARGESLSKRQLAAAMDVMDTDGSGAVDFAEFESWWHEHGGARPPALDATALVLESVSLAHSALAQVIWRSTGSWR